MCRYFFAPKAFNFGNSSMKLYMQIDPSDAEQLAKNLPAPLPLSFQSLNPSGAYLLDAVFLQYIWIGKAASPELVAAITGLPSVDSNNQTGMV
jgi:hypothetical protein